MKREKTCIEPAKRKRKKITHPPNHTLNAYVLKDVLIQAVFLLGKE